MKRLLIVSHNPHYEDSDAIVCPGFERNQGIPHYLKKFGIGGIINPENLQGYVDMIS